MIKERQKNMDINKTIRGYVISRIHVHSCIDKDASFEKVIIPNLSKYEEALKDSLGVYFYNKDRNIYIGESTNLKDRITSHIQTRNMQTNGKLVCFTSEFFNESVIYEIETALINYIKRMKDIKGVELNFMNKILTQKFHEYYKRRCYKPFVDSIERIINQEIEKISQIHIDLPKIKKSPEWILNPNILPTKEQDIIVTKIYHSLMNDDQINVFGVSGKAGSGKTLVAVQLFDKLIKSNYKGNTYLTSGVPELTRNFLQVFKKKIKNNFNISTPGKMINTYKKNNKKIDILIIDETHRLKQPKTGKATHLATRHIESGSTEFKELIKMACKVIFIYDEDQICMPADIQNLDSLGKPYKKFELLHQMRNDSNFDKQLDALIKCEDKKYISSVKINVYSTFKEFYTSLQEDKDNKLNPVIVSTLDRPKKIDGKNFDQFNYGNIKLSWMKKVKNWALTDDALNLKSVGYFHYIQGFELDSIGVIIGKNLKFENNEIKVDFKYSHNHFQYVLGEYENNIKLSFNRLRVLLSRARKKLHIFIEDSKLRHKWQEILS